MGCVETRTEQTGRRNERLQNVSTVTQWANTITLEEHGSQAGVQTDLVQNNGVTQRFVMVTQ